MVTVERNKEPYLVHLDVFTGPLDLLLHLVQKEEVSIYDISIARITEQYMQYMGNLDELDVDLASDFLVMAATLLQYKARLLLPKPSFAEAEGDQDEESTLDPREELIRKLATYKKFKDGAEALQKRLSIQECCVARWPGFRPQPATITQPLTSMPAEALLAAYRTMLQSVQQEVKNHYVAPENISLRSRIRVILEHIHPGERRTFRELLGERPTRLEILVTFLALLELTRLGVLSVYQTRIFGPLELWRRPREQRENPSPDSGNEVKEA